MIFILGFLLLERYRTSSTDVKDLNYSEFRKEVQSGNVKEVTISHTELRGILKTPKDAKFKTFIPYEDDKLAEFLESNSVVVKASPPTDTPWWYVALNFFPYLLLIGFIFLILRQAQSGGSQAFSFGRSRAKLLTDNRSKVTFEDVAGVEEAKEELKEVVDFLKYPKKYQALGARIPKGVLLLGAPGTGKTLLGRAIAGEAGVPFFYISGSDFVEMFVGVGASRVRDLFEQSKKSAPCIVFVDEIDAVGRQRGAGLGGGHDEREQTLNQLLVEMDGFEPNNGVIVLAATNRPDVLDPALLRPGRFDRHVVVDKPDVAGRKAILKVHSRGKPIDTTVDLDIIARRTPGFSGADLENLLNEAALLAARTNKSKIEMPDCEEAIDRVIVGPERKSRIISDKEKKVTAYHEAGHALIAKLLPDADPVRKVTILPRGMALGITWTMPAEDKHLRSKKELVAEIIKLLGGRVAEEIVFGELTTGASNDLERSTEIARNIVTKYGMSEKLGPLTYGKKHEQVFLGRDIMEDRNYSESVGNTIDDEVHAIVDSSYVRAKEILNGHRNDLEKIVEVLLEKEVLEGEELDRLLDDEGDSREESAEKPEEEPDSEQEAATPPEGSLKDVFGEGNSSNRLAFES
ncbi:MAG: ATP-dependent zinc metalloprotease FtsH [Candidatus Eremiobacteraeota bacterium]|nr:ATP-dependent zinc metalloprotease FtsH [Candidatus Eremiobacteraeota bacterium]